MTIGMRSIITARGHFCIGNRIEIKSISDADLKSELRRRVRSSEAVSQPQDIIVCVPIPSRHTLPNADRAIVEIAKLRDYCLNPNHEDGKHKARVFASALGIRQSDAEWLREILLVAARNEDATAAGKNRFGTLYVLDSTVTTSLGSAVVRSGWIVQFTEGFPRLTTCYVKKRVSL